MGLRSSINLVTMLWILFTTSTVAAVIKRDVPDFVKDYAPILRLHSTEKYFPSDIAAQVANTIPEADRTAIQSPPLTLHNLDVLNSLGGTNVYLTSKEGIQALPPWFEGVSPSSQDASLVKSSAVITVDKSDIGSGVVDVFYFYFYAYNLGNEVNIFGHSIGNFGNHVGDWEHVMIRFQDGVPQAVWLSQHADGEAFTYDTLEKEGGRPVIYVGLGTHANWAITGPHEHTIPGLSLPFKGLLTDMTDAGPRYDAISSSYFYQYDGTKFSSYASEPVNWLYYQGQWGDQQLDDNAQGQVNLFGQRKYTSGPNGPLFKDLMRSEICPKADRPCIVRPFLTP